jgi:nucleoside-diphosphate-sugar epimerase
MAETSVVLVTGGSGFLGAHCIIKCLAAGYTVRTTIRSLKREADVRKMLEVGDAPHLDRLSFFVADLTKDEGWKEAIEGCTYILHVASPFPPGAPKDENDLIIPARDGSLRVLRLARDAGVKRVVITSSLAAIAYGHGDAEVDYTEKTWTNPEGSDVNPYIKSKALAERAAWDFIEKEGVSLELSVVNPGGIFGPVLGSDYAVSVELVERLLNGDMPACPQLSFGVVDVRDVADLHVFAMTKPEAKGERFICISPPEMSVQDMSLALREKLGGAAKKCPTRVLPNFVLKMMAWFDPTVALIMPELGKTRVMTNEKAKKMLGWEPRPNVDAVVATAESLIKLGLVKKTQLDQAESEDPTKKM